MANILILYSTTDGHTLTICKRLQQTIEQAGNRVSLLALDDAGTTELESFDKIVLGASIRYGKHRPQVFEFIKANLPVIDRKPNAFFTVNIVARKPAKSCPETNPYMRKFLAQTPWRPGKLAVFAGRLDYPRYGFFDRQMIRFIMLLTHGPTDPATVVEFTDWQRVEEFGSQIDRM